MALFSRASWIFGIEEAEVVFDAVGEERKVSVSLEYRVPCTILLFPA
jgi:hypothetical protein